MNDGFLVNAYIKIYVPRHEISNKVVCATSNTSDQPAHTRSLTRAFASRLNIIWVLSYWLNIIWSFLAIKEAARARLMLHLSNITCLEPTCRGSIIYTFSMISSYFVLSLFIKKLMTILRLLIWWKPVRLFMQYRHCRQSELPRPIPWNQTSDEHRGTTLITWRWRYRNHAKYNIKFDCSETVETVTTFHKML